ncbi:hypothetical protein K502DRAFT_342518 [Neoconidiobolus thromboides FSU 785]|nr:hypothetical protein K502DRAFT_342518 [Neoconidiobolus thromboides FSU 785]
MVSTDLLWEVTKRNNTYLVKRSGVTFSRDPLNLTNLHNRAQAGFIQTNAIGLVAGPKGVTAHYTTGAKNFNKPSKHLVKVNVRANHFKQGQKKIVGLVTRNAHRDDQYKNAQLRAFALYRSNNKRVKPTTKQA